MTAQNKIVNGELINLTVEESVAIEAEWQAIDDQRAIDYPGEVKAVAKQQANNQATLIVSELFVDLIEALIAKGTITAMDFPAETRTQYQALKSLIDTWRSMPDS